MEYLLPYLCMVTVPHIMVGLERMLDYRGVGLERFHCTMKLWFSYAVITVKLQQLCQNNVQNTAKLQVNYGRATIELR